MRSRVQWGGWSVISAALILLGGCGAGTVSPVSAPVKTSAAALNGNWLLVGTLPFADPLQPVGNNSLGLALTISSVGDSLVAGGSENVPCGLFTVGGAGSVVNGTVGSDGSFSLQPPASYPPTLSALTIKGTLPAANATTWSGSYTFANNNTSCPLTQSGTLTATKIADLTGTYAGGTSVNFTGGSISSTPQPLTLTFSLQQGANLPGTAQFSAELLSGTVRIQGNPCFSSGTSAVAAGSGVLGTEFVTSFTLDDGSLLQLTGSIEDAATSKVNIRFLHGSGSKCGTFFGGPFRTIRQ